MKKLFFLSSSAFIVFLFVFQTGVSSCTKTVTDTVTISRTDTLIKTDTLQEKDTTLTAAILTANSWKIQEIRGLYGNSYIYYLLGGSGNTQSFDNEYITFNANNTGVYTDNGGGQSTFTWQFTNTANTELVWIWNLSTPVTVTWENIGFDDGAIRYTEYYTQFGNSVLSSVVRIPR